MQPTFCYQGLPSLKEDFEFSWARNRPLTLGTEFLRDHTFLKPVSTKHPGFVPSTRIQQTIENKVVTKHEELNFGLLTGMAPSRPKAKRFSMTYVALIASAILRVPEKRLTLSQIYQVIEKTFPEFTVSRTGWKNTVRHNLSLHECFVKGEVSTNGKSCFWHIHPAYIARFSKGDFRKRPCRELCTLEEHRNYPRIGFDRIQPYPVPYLLGAPSTRFEFNASVGGTEQQTASQRTIFPGSSSSVQQACVNATVHSSTEWLNEYKPYPYYYLFSSPRNASLNPQQTGKQLILENSTCSSGVH